MSWQAIDSSLTDDPITGSVDDYYAATRAVSDRVDGTEALRAGIAWIAEVADRGPWRGIAATALAGRLASVAVAAEREAGALAELTSVLVRHASVLDTLRERAAVTLHGALADLDELRQAERRLAEAHRVLAEAGAAGADEPLRARIDALESAVAAGARRLSSWVPRFGDLADEELRLAGATAAAVADLATAFAAAPAVTRLAVGTAGPACAAPGLMAGSVLARQFELLASELVAHLTSLPVAFGAQLMTPWAEAFAERPHAEQVAIITALAHVHRALGGRRAAGDGDLGGTYEWEPRGSWAGRLDAANPSVAGASVVADALALTTGSRWLAPDEFGLVELAGGRYLVVLPGVTDLSHPHLGYDPGHRTVRDVDVHALPSSTSSATADNRYASMVAAGLAEAGVLPGSELLIVGHSFGADTALDLAADPHFNGDDGYTVTHVVAAGYHSGPQLAAVPAATNVLVLQNRHDGVVGVEQIAEHPVAVGDALGEAWDAATDANPMRVLGSLVDAGNELVAMGPQAGAPPAPLPPLPDLPWNGGGPHPTRVTTPTATQTVAVFDGARRGWGHHQDNYIEYLGQHADAAVARFTADVVTAGYATPGQVVAIDVSVPLERRGGR